ncbi:MAG: SDR family NAD(P)-dependent oxidoreductase [Candidatus Manganitrophaceae bacterium]
MVVTGHKVLVTGGSAGIGLALARAFRERENRVMVCGRNPERLTKAAREIPGLLTFQCNVANEEELKRLVKGVEAELGGLSILVNNAGIQRNYDFIKVAVEPALRDIDDEIEINLTALVKLSLLTLPLLRRESTAAVVNISSGLALVPKRSAPVYCATKAAVHFFSKALRYQMEEAASSVGVFEVLPPQVDTEMTRGRGKMKLTADQVARAVIRGIAADRHEIRIGLVKPLVWIQRLHPWLADRILRNS